MSNAWPSNSRHPPDGADGNVSSVFGFLSKEIKGRLYDPAAENPRYIAPGRCGTLKHTNPPVPNVRNELHDDVIAWRVGRTFNESQESLLYANVTRGFKAGSYGALPLIPTAQAVPIVPKRLTACEAGFKSSFADHLHTFGSHLLIPLALLWTC